MKGITPIVFHGELMCFDCHSALLEYRSKKINKILSSSEKIM